MKQDNKPKRKWSNYSIYPRFQFSIVAFNLFTLSGALGIIYYQLSKSFWVIETYSQSVNSIQFEKYKNLIEVHFELVKDAMITSFIFSAVFIIIYNLVFTHKSAGAIHHMKEYCRDIIKNGHTRKLSFREGDMHSDLPELVNQAIDRIQKDSSKSGE